MAQIVVIIFKAFGNGEVRHQRAMINAIEGDLITDLLSVCQDLGDISKEFVHLSCRLHPLLLAIAHAFGIIEILPRAKTNESVVRLCILFVEEVDVVSGDDLDAVLFP